MQDWLIVAASPELLPHILRWIEIASPESRAKCAEGLIRAIVGEHLRASRKTSNGVAETLLDVIERAEVARNTSTLGSLVMEARSILHNQSRFVYEKWFW